MLPCACWVGKLKRAAEQYRVTLAALTKAIQKLERELDGALIDRDRQLTQLTGLVKLTLDVRVHVTYRRPCSLLCA
jgi:Bacterial regulatory helix-turn-helix protein, lysR family